MRKILAAALGAALAANGLFMLFDPAAWYGAVPGVAATGPLNPHFVRDIGCAYLTAGAALAGGAFLALHALVHLFDWASGMEPVDRFLADLPAVFAPPAIALWLALPGRILNKEKYHAEMADPPAPRRL